MLMFKNLAAFPQRDFCHLMLYLLGLSFQKIGSGLRKHNLQLIFLFSFISIFWQLLKKSLCHFQPFCFHPVKPQLCKPWLPPLSIFGAPIHQRQGTGVRGGKETLQIQGTSSAGPSPRILVEMCQGGAWP